jgi:hypothetical protein
MANARNNKLPTEKQIEEAINYANRDEEKITDRMAITIQKTFQKIIDYDPHKLSTTVRSEIARIYALEMYNRCPASTTADRLAVEKGSLSELEAIKHLSRVDGTIYEKNDELLISRYIKGKPDVIVGNKKRAKKVIDVKCSLDLVSFLQIVDRETLDIDYEWQMQGYLHLTKCDVGEVCYCLVDMPYSIMEVEKKRIFRRANELGLSYDIIDAKIEQLERNMTYGDIPEEKRVKRFKVYRDDRMIEDINSRAQVARKWLRLLHKKFEKPSLSLLKTTTLLENMY